MDLRGLLKNVKINEPTISAILGALVVLTIVILLVNYFRGKTNIPSGSLPAVQTENKQNQVSSLATHKVAKGDNLWKIAEKYYQSGYNWVDIAKANNLKNPNVIAENLELTIPQVATKQIATKEQNQAQALPAQITKTAASVEAITGDTYTVEKGDSLWKIAVRTYSDGYQWPKLAKANNLKNPNLIYPDQKFKLLPR